MKLQMRKLQNQGIDDELSHQLIGHDDIITQ